MNRPATCARLVALLDAAHDCDRMGGAWPGLGDALRAWAHAVALRVLMMVTETCAAWAAGGA